jgi:methylase of polypeptide subunit release factors
VLGWSRPFRRGSIPQDIVELLAEARELEERDGLLRSKVRFSTLGRQLFIHSAFPTDQPDAVFFGPDTYRFVRSLAQWLKNVDLPSPLRIIDIGCGSGAGGLAAASLLDAQRPELVLADINARALRYSRINAAINEILHVKTVKSDVFAGIEGAASLIISNPPYLVDRGGRLYRHGGGEFGCDLSLRIAQESVDRLVPGGCLFLYTGSPVVDGTQVLRQALSPALARRGCSFACEEIDPDVFGEELDTAPYNRVDRIAAVAVTVRVDS